MPDPAPEPGPVLPRLILCADDFAMSAGVSETIADLARQGCINAISCMAAMPRWREDSRLLDGIEHVTCGELGPVQVGLHLVLASERPLGPMSCTLLGGRLPGPDAMLLRAWTRGIDLGELAAEIDRQFIAFREARGCAPDFVDAHQHVHLHPGIRGLVIAATLRHAPRAWVRVPGDRLAAMLARPHRGKALGSAFHALGLRWQLRRAGLASNASFAGHYGFTGDYRSLIPAFLRYGSSAHLVMCHPGSGTALGDTIARAREVEAQAIGEMTLAERMRAPAPSAAGLLAHG